MSHINIYNGSSVGDIDILNLIMNILRHEIENAEDITGTSMTKAKAISGERVHVFAELIQEEGNHERCFTIVDSDVAEADLKRLAEEEEQEKENASNTSINSN
jgi:hypothetical protein